MKKIILPTLILFALLIDASVSAAEEYQFSYSVPVKKEKLEPYATFKLKNTSYSESPQGIEIGFDLPEELVGLKPIHILLKQDPQVSTHFSGENAQADCQSENSNSPSVYSINYALSCQGYSLPLAAHLFTSDITHYFKRLAVAHSFCSDPIGILTLSIPTP